MSFKKRNQTARANAENSSVSVSCSPSNSTEVKVDTRESRLIPKGTFSEYLSKRNFDPQVVTFAIQCLKCLLEVGVLYGMDTPATRQGPEFARSYASGLCTSLKNCMRFFTYHGSTSQSIVKYFKYKTVAFFNHWEKQEMPQVPEGLERDHPGYLFGGVIGQFFRRLAKVSPTFLLSILMAKKGMPRALESDLRQAEAAMVRELSTVRAQRIPTIPYQALPQEEQEWIDDRLHYIYGTDEPVPWSPAHYGRKKSVTVAFMLECRWLAFEEGWDAMPAPRKTTIDLSVSAAKAQLRRTAREMFAHKRFSVADMSAPAFPSTSSNYNNSRGKGGGVGFFLEESDLLKGLSTPIVGVKQHLGVIYDRQTELYGQRGIEEIINPHESLETIVYELDFHDVDIAYRDFYWRAFRYAMTEEPVVKPVALPEALKIRVISKGPPATYFVLKTFQQFLWGSLKDHPTFRLIGRPVTVEDVEEVCGHDLRSYFCSGDYVSSTDRLYSWVSETLLDELATVLDLPDELVTLSKRALTGHVFEHETLDGGRAEQATGQLMGSIISFPFLCLANAALCRWSYEIVEKKRFRLSDIPMLINGDDNLVETKDKRYYDWWLACCSVAGLDSSLGKTYFTNKFAVINSQHFDHTHGQWILRPFVNMGLLRGLKRSSTGTEVDGGLLCDVAERYNQLKSTCPDDIWARTRARFLYNNQNKLKNFKGSWWLPRYAGGLGMIPDEPSSSDCRTLYQARRLLNQGYEVLPLPNKRDWATWRIAEHKLKELCPDNCQKRPFQRLLYDQDYDLEVEQSLVSKYMCITSFFQETLKTLLPKDERDPVKMEARAVRKNYSFYRKASNLAKLDTRAVPKDDFQANTLKSFRPVVLRR